jgi:hypothetical protein
MPSPEKLPWISEPEASIACHALRTMEAIRRQCPLDTSQSLSWAPMREVPSGRMDPFFHWVCSNIITQWMHLEFVEWGVPFDQRCPLDAGCFLETHVTPHGVDYKDSHPF